MVYVNVPLPPLAATVITPLHDVLHKGAVTFTELITIGTEPGTVTALVTVQLLASEIVTVYVNGDKPLITNGLLPGPAPGLTGLVVAVYKPVPPDTFKVITPFDWLLHNGEATLTELMVNAVGCVMVNT